MEPVDVVTRSVERYIDRSIDQSLGDLMFPAGSSARYDQRTKPTVCYDLESRPKTPITNFTSRGCEVLLTHGFQEGVALSQ
jgi:hypothetical protein